MSLNENLSLGLPHTTRLRLEELDVVFVDLDDTIVEYRTACKKAFREVTKLLPELGNEDVERLEIDYQLLRSENLPKLFYNVISPEEERKERLDMVLRTRDIHLEDSLLELMNKVFNDSFWKNRRASDGAVEFLEMCRVKSVPVTVITNGDREMQEKSLEVARLKTLVESVITPMRLEEMKPNSSLFERALRVTASRKEHTVMIGDSWEYDVVGALKAGIKPIWVNRSKLRTPPDSGVEWVTSLSDLTQNMKGGDKNV